jgi:hypothetical protein
MNLNAKSAAIFSNICALKIVIRGRLFVHPAGMAKMRYCFPHFLPQGQLPRAEAPHYLHLPVQAPEDSPEPNMSTAGRGSSCFLKLSLDLRNT